jgi:hypothetical protein
MADLIQELESIVHLKRATNALGAFADELSGETRDELRKRVSELRRLIKELEEDLSSIDVHASPTKAGTLAIHLEARRVERETSYLRVVCEGARAKSKDRFEHSRTIEITSGGARARIAMHGLQQGLWHVTVKAEDGWSESKDVEIRVAEEAEVYFVLGGKPGSAAGSKA